MNNPDLRSDYAIQQSFEDNFDPPQFEEVEPWKEYLAKMKAAILEKKFLKAQYMMYHLEFKIIDSNIKSYNEGYRNGSQPLPF